MTRVNELIKRELANALFRIMTEQNFDLSAVTITHVETGRSLRSAKVYVSIRDHRDERRQMMALLQRHRLELQEHLNANLHLKYTPRLVFTMDPSVEKGDAILGLLAELADREDPDAPAEDVAPGVDAEGDEDREPLP